MRRTRLVLTAMAAMSIWAAPALAMCPSSLQTHEPAAAPGPVNIDQVKSLLKAYHSSGYEADMQAVTAAAQTYILSRADMVKQPAVILDIDETSLSNWQEIEIDGFGFIRLGPCTLKAGEACGFHEWVRLAKAPALLATLGLFQAIKSKVAIFFVTGRDQVDDQATTTNLQTAGYDGWSGLFSRPNPDPHSNVADFKRDARIGIEAKGYTILANIGDQLSDLDSGHAECTFKLPNPFYFIP